MAVDIWAQTRRVFWPRPTKGKWFIGQAVDAIGRHLFREDWRIEDMRAKRIFPRELPTFIEGASGGRSLSHGSRPLSQEGRRQMHDALCRRIEQDNAAAMQHNESVGPALARRYHVQRIIGAAAADERLDTFYRSHSDLSDQSIPPAYWAEMWAAAVFEEGTVPPSTWMRELDRTFGTDADVFFIEAQVRSIDWARVQWRIDPEPLGEPVATGDEHNEPVRDQIATSSKPARRLATKEETEGWYIERVATAVASGTRYSRIEDEAAGRLIGVRRDRVRELRGRHAPAEWGDGGRPSNDRIKNRATKPVD